MTKLSTYARIVKAAYDNHGVVLTWEECWEMGFGDDAIARVGESDLEANGYGWDRKRKRYMRSGKDGR